MKYRLFGLLLLPNVLLGQSPSATTERTLILAHVTVIDATGSAAKPDMSVFIRDHRIVAVNETGKLTELPNGDVVDAKGKFLIPGLWDSPSSEMRPFFKKVGCCHHRKEQDELVKLQAGQIVRGVQ